MKFLRYLAEAAIIIGIGLIVFGLSGWYYVGPSSRPGSAAYAGLAKTSQYEVTAGAMLVAGGILARRNRIS